MNVGILITKSILFSIDYLNAFRSQELTPEEMECLDN